MAGGGSDFSSLPEEQQELHIKARITQLIEQSDAEARETGKPKPLSYRAFRTHCSATLGFDFSASAQWKAKLKALVQDRVKAHESRGRDGSIFEEARQILGGAASGNGSSSSSRSTGAGTSAGRTTSQAPPLGFQQIKSPSIFGTGRLHPPQLRSPGSSPPRMGFMTSPGLTPSKGPLTHHGGDLTPSNGLIGATPATPGSSSRGVVTPSRASGWDSHTVHEAYQMRHPGHSGGAPKMPSPPKHLSASDNAIRPVDVPHHRASSDRRLPSETTNHSTTTSSWNPQNSHLAPPPAAAAAVAVTGRHRGHRTTPARASDDPMRHHTSKARHPNPRTYSQSVYSALRGPSSSASGHAAATGVQLQPGAQPYSHLSQSPGAHAVHHRTSGGVGGVMAGGAGSFSPVHHHPNVAGNGISPFHQRRPFDDGSRGGGTQDLLPTGSPFQESHRSRSRSRSPPRVGGGGVGLGGGGGGGGGGGDFGPRSPANYNTQEYGRNSVRSQEGPAVLQGPSVARSGPSTGRDHQFVHTPMADPSIWRWKGSGATMRRSDSPPTTRHSALLINRQRMEQVTSADQIGSFSKPRHERSPPPPKSGTLGGGDQHQPYSRQQQQQEVQNSVRHLSSSAFAGEGRGGERSFSGSASASAAGGMNPSNMGGGAPFLDLSTSSPAQRLFQPGGGGGSGGGGDAPGQARRTRLMQQRQQSHPGPLPLGSRGAASWQDSYHPRELSQEQQQVNSLCDEFGIQPPFSSPQVAERVHRVVFSKKAKLGISFMNFDAHIDFFGTILHAQVRKVSSYAMSLGVRPGMLVRYIHDWDCSRQSLEQVRNALWEACLVRPVIIAFAIPVNIPLSQ